MLLYFVLNRIESNYRHGLCCADDTDANCVRPYRHWTEFGKVVIENKCVTIHYAIENVEFVFVLLLSKTN